MVAETVSTTGVRGTSLPVRCWRYDLGIRKSILETVSYRGSACCSGHIRSGCLEYTRQSPVHAGYAQAEEDRKAEEDKVRQYYEQEKVTNEREAQQRIDQARNDALDAAASVAGCSNNSLPSVSSSGSITPLSALGRQPQTPEFCLPTCSANLSRETDNWQSMLTGQPKPEESAKNSTTL